MCALIIVRPEIRHRKRITARCDVYSCRLSESVPTDLTQILYFFFKFQTRGLSSFGACVKLGSIEGFDISAVACARLLIPDPPPGSDEVFPRLFSQ